MVFLKQAKLLANYEDDVPFTGTVTRYYPTYQSLTNEELRGYFTWRTRLRRGSIEKTSLSFAFLYIYELLNQIGVADPLDGYQKLTHFRVVYGGLDEGILPYLDRWMTDYVVYYDLDPALAAHSPQLALNRAIEVLEQIQTAPTQAVMEALEQLSLKWLKRSKFYQKNKQQMDELIVRVLRRISAHCSTRCKKSFIEQYVAVRQRDLVLPFEGAVFCDPLKRKHYQYALDSRSIYFCQNGCWMVEKYFSRRQQCAKLDELMKTIDAMMRVHTGDKHPIMSPVSTKWILKIIQEELDGLEREKQAAQAKKITIDTAQLAKIRRDAAITQEKLTVDEEPELSPPLAPEVPDIPAAPAVPETPQAPAGCPLEGAEYRLLHCILYGTDRSWVRTEGHLLSVLLDSINDKLYDVFQDSVLDDAGQPLDDYIDELKEMVAP